MPLVKADRAPMSDSAIHAMLNEGSLVELTRIQRELGREQVPSWYRDAWRKRHAAAADVLRARQTPCVVREMALVLHNVTYYLGTVEPPEQPNYYQYTDARMLDWYLASASDLDSFEQLSVDGVHALCDDLRRVETAFLADAEPGPGIDAPSIRQRIALLDRVLADLAAIGARQRAPGAACETVEEYVRAASRIPALVHLAAMPLTPHHDEYAFLRVLQGSELCFFGIRIAVSAAIEAVKAQQPAQAAIDVAAATRFAEVLCGLLRVLRTMPVSHFAAFRYNTGSASAIQSINFQMLDIVLHGANGAKVPHLLRFEHLAAVARMADPRFVSLHAAVRHANAPGAEWDAFREACRRLDRTLLTWRGLHLSFAKTYIPNDGPGTGGTSGAAYLREHLLRGIFDDGEPDWDAIEELFPAGPVRRVRPGVAIAP